MLELGSYGSIVGRAGFRYILLHIVINMYHTNFVQSLIEDRLHSQYNIFHDEHNACTIVISQLMLVEG